MPYSVDSGRLDRMEVDPTLWLALLVQSVALSVKQVWSLSLSLRNRASTAVACRTRLGPYSRTTPMVLWKSQGGWALFYERGTPVDRQTVSWAS